MDYYDSYSVSPSISCKDAGWVRCHQASSTSWLRCSRLKADGLAGNHLERRTLAQDLGTWDTELGPTTSWWEMSDLSSLSFLLWVDSDRDDGVSPRGCWEGQGDHTNETAGSQTRHWSEVGNPRGQSRPWAVSPSFHCSLLATPLSPPTDEHDALHTVGSPYMLSKKTKHNHNNSFIAIIMWMHFTCTHIWSAPPPCEAPGYQR